jgi:hypothetical protein
MNTSPNEQTYPVSATGLAVFTAADLEKDDRSGRSGAQKRSDKGNCANPKDLARPEGLEPPTS